MADDRRRAAAVLPARTARRHAPSVFTVIAAVVAAVTALRFAQPLGGARPFERLVAGIAPTAQASGDAFGRSGSVHVRFAMPGGPVDYPLEVEGDPADMSYHWVRLPGHTPVDSGRPLAGARVIAPVEPGFYRLALARGGAARVLDQVTVGVMVPFEAKENGAIGAYRIGTYLSERLGGGHRPEGFVRVDAELLDLQLTTHLRLGDFVTHDDQREWPRYVALSPRLLDKLELVFGAVSEGRPAGSDRLLVDIHSGFRTPAHNRSVRRAARDSRHQYGDAADVTVDVNGDGRFTLADSRELALVVDRVERDFPDLVGGLGLYVSRRVNTPYVHIDARGRRARWRG